MVLPCSIVLFNLRNRRAALSLNVNRITDSTQVMMLCYSCCMDFSIHATELKGIVM
jgi:hypothetical protein